MVSTIVCVSSSSSFFTLLAISSGGTTRSSAPSKMNFWSLVTVARRMGSSHIARMSWAVMFFGSSNSSSWVNSRPVSAGFFDSAAN